MKCDLYVVDRSGNPFGIMEKAKIDHYEEVKNGWGTAKFDTSVFDPKAKQLLSKDNFMEREVQIWRDGKLDWWGRPLQPRANKRTVEYNCEGLLSYYNDLFYGPNTFNALLNNDFEDGLAGWTSVGNPGATVSTNNFAKGSKAARLSVVGANQDRYIRQQVVMDHRPTNPTPGFILTFDVSINLFVEAFTNPAFQERGLYVSNTVNGVVTYEKWEKLNHSFPRGHWERMEVPVDTQTGEVNIVEVRLYACEGTVVYDLGKIGVSSGVGAWDPDDSSVILSRIINWASAISPINIGANVAPTGQRVSRLHLLEDNANIWQSMEEFPCAGLGDLAVTWNAAGTIRQVTSYYPRKGSFKPDAILMNGKNLLDWDYPVDGKRTKNHWRVLGVGRGANREYGLASDPSALGGLVLMGVLTAPQETPIVNLDRMANEQLQAKKKPVAIPSLQLNKRGTAELIDVIQTGDTVPVRIDWGWVDENSNKEIVAKRIHPKSKTMSVELNNE